MVIRGCKGVLGTCDSFQGGVKDVKTVCQLKEKCDAHRRSVQEVEDV